MLVHSKMAGRLRAKAAVNAPHSRRFAKWDTLSSRVSVWNAVALAPLWQTDCMATLAD
jgi:hypothetical protein